MRPRERRDSGQNDLFRARLDQIVDTDHSLAKLGRAIDWGFLEGRFGAVYSDKAGHPPLPTRLMAGLSILNTCTISPTRICARAGSESLLSAVLRRGVLPAQADLRPLVAHALAQRMGEEKLVALIQESLSVATRTGAAKPATSPRSLWTPPCSLRRSPFRPTPSSCIGRASGWSSLARKTGVSLRQSYERIGKYALIAHQRYAHAKQFKRANRALKRSAPISAASRATSCARSRATPRWRASSPIRSCSPFACASSASISAEKKS